MENKEQDGRGSGEKYLLELGAGHGTEQEWLGHDVSQAEQYVAHCCRTVFIGSVFPFSLPPGSVSLFRCWYARSATVFNTANHGPSPHCALLQNGALPSSTRRRTQPSIRSATTDQPRSQDRTTTASHHIDITSFTARPANGINHNSQAEQQ